MVFLVCLLVCDCSWFFCSIADLSLEFRSERLLYISSIDSCLSTKRGGGGGVTSSNKNQAHAHRENVHIAWACNDIRTFGTLALCLGTLVRVPRQKGNVEMAKHFSKYGNKGRAFNYQVHAILNKFLLNKSYVKYLMVHPYITASRTSS